jgi:DNA-binding PadR family transcriptional regulator
LLYFQIGHIMPDMNRKRTPDVERWLPLQPRQFWILIVLSEADRHGYAILKAARAKAASGLGLGPTTLYRMLYRLVDEGLVEPTAAPDTELDERRQYYGLTKLGHAVLEAEVRRLERMVELGRTAVGRAGAGGH